MKPEINHSRSNAYSALRRQSYGASVTEAAAKAGQFLDKAIFCLILLLLLYTPLFLIPHVRTLETVLHVKFLLVGFLGNTAAALCVIRLFLFSLRSHSGEVGFRGKQPFTRDPVRLLILGYAASILISSLFSGEAAYCLREAMKVLPLLVIVMTFPLICRSVADFEKIKSVILFSGALVAIYGLCQYARIPFLNRWFPYVYEESALAGLGRNYILSTIGNPEYLGSYLAPLLLIAFSEIPLGMKRLRGVISLILCLIFLPALLLTGARGALIGIAAGGGMLTIYYFIRLRRTGALKRMGWAPGLLICVAALTIFLFSFPNPINRYNQAIWGRFRELTDLRSSSIKERIMFHAIGTEMIAEKPIKGWGEGMFRIQFYPMLARLGARDERAGVARFMEELKNRVADHAHNDYLQIWAEDGAIGFLTFTLAVALVIGGAFKTLFSRSDTEVRLRRILIFSAGFLCLLVNAAFSFPLHTPERAVLFWCLFGVTHAAVLTFERNQQ